MNVYVISSAGGMCKIGIAADARARLGGLVTGHPYALEITKTFEVETDHAREIERKAHGHLQTHRMQGEWFRVSPEEAVAAVQRALDPLLNEPPSPPLRCGVCRYARHRTRGEYEGFECHISPPAIDGWPRVDSTEWCSQFSRMSDAEDDI